MNDINLPPALAERRAALANNAEQSRRDASAHEMRAEECQDSAASCLAKAELCEAEIAGIDAATEAFAELLAKATSERVAPGGEPAAERRERRDIRGMVLDELRARQPDAYTEGELAKILPGVRPTQIGNALAYHEAGGRVCHKDGHWRAVTNEPDELPLEAAG